MKNLMNLIYSYSISGYSTDLTEDDKDSEMSAAKSITEEINTRFGSVLANKVDLFIGFNFDTAKEYVLSIYREFIDFGDSEGDKRRALEMSPDIKLVLRSIPFISFGYPGFEGPEETE